MRKPIYRYGVLLWGVWSLISSPGDLQAASVPSGVKLATEQQLVINNGIEVQTLDPHKTTGLPEARVMRNVLEGLVILDPHGSVVPGVAARWQHTPDLKTWTFYLRPEARWSNGDPLTAHDFVYSWRRLANPQTKSPKANYLVDMRLVNSEAVLAGKKAPEALGVQALDNHTLQLQLTQPLSYLVEMLAYYVLFPLHAPTVERYGNGYDEDKWYAVVHHVGNGAYRLNEWVVNEKLVLTRSPTYWDNQHTVIEQVTYLAIADEVVDVRRYLAGEIDITNARLPLDHWSQLQQERPQEIYQVPSWCLYCFECNTTRVPFNDRRVRRALAMVLDRQALVTQLTRQGETAAYTVNPTGMGKFVVKPPDWAHWPQTQRNQVASALLQEAGYSEQHPLTITLLFNTSEVHLQIALAVSSMWQQHLKCVKVNFESQEWKAFLRTRLEGTFQLARNGWQAVYSEPSALLNLLLSSNLGSSTGYKSTLFDNLLAQAALATEEAKRHDYYQQAESQLAADMPVIPLFHYTRVRVVKPYVGGYSRSNPMDTLYVKDLYLIRDEQLPSRYRQ